MTHIRNDTATEFMASGSESRRLAALLGASIAVTVAAPWSGMGALRTDVTRYARRQRALGMSPELVMVRLRSICRPSMQPGLVGPHRAWVAFVLNRIVSWATHM
ncbi:MAG TPA: hypothetical protein VNW46_14720 [Gemmatimonadaceae bacterium]|jgi:hypothetical protein|nr:hypothetical protein [Gemmatimonadaceae bacterium]